MHIVRMINVYETEAMKKFNKAEAFNPNFDKHQLKIQAHMAIIGGTGCGKTNFLMNYLSQMYNTFGHVYIWTGMPDEDLYKMLSDKLKDDCTIEHISKVRPYQQIVKEKPGIEKLIVFDDFITEKKMYKTLEQYAIMSRKANCTCLFLSQSFHEIPKMIRLQCSYLCLLEQSNKKDMTLIGSNIALDIEPSTIRRIVQNATDKKLNVCIVNLRSRREPNKIFRRNFIEFYDIMDKGDELNTIMLYP